MKKTDINKLIRCRDIIDFYIACYKDGEESYDEIEKYTLAGLKKNGFKAIKEFLDFNNTMCLDLLKELLVIKGTCDLCGETTITNQPCVSLYKDRACAKKESRNPEDELYSSALSYIRNGRKIEDNVELRGMCKKGHGFYAIKLESNQPLPFPLEWTYHNSRPPNSNWVKSQFIAAGINKKDLK